MVNFHDYYSQDIYLAHHGIKGQKWGIRRYQNPDGTYTNAGKKRRKILDDATKFAEEQQRMSGEYAKNIRIIKK